jgi:hypothetical protein
MFKIGLIQTSQNKMKGKNNEGKRPSKNCGIVSKAEAHA